MELYLDPLTPESVMEVKSAMELDGLVYKREKFSLPCGERDKQRGYYFFTLNTSQRSIGSLIKNEHNLILNRANSYNSYYYNHKLLRNLLVINNVIVPGVTIPDAKNERLSRYASMKDIVEGVRTPINLDVLHGRNFVYDLNPVVSLMSAEPKMKKQSLARRIEVYFNTLYKIIRAPLDTKLSYTRGPVFINLDEKKNYDSVDDYHFLTYLIMLFRKQQSFMDNFKVPYKIIFYTTKGYLVFDMGSDLIKKNLSKLKFAIKRLSPSTDFDRVETLVVRDELASKLNTVNGFTGDNEIEPDDDIVDTVAKSTGVDEELFDEDGPTNRVDAIPEEELKFESLDDEAKKEYYEGVLSKKTGYEMKDLSPRDKMLRAQQSLIKIKGTPIGELVKDIDPPALESRKVNPPGEFKVPNNSDDIKFTGFEKLYNETMLPKQLAEVFTSFNDKSINATVIDVQVEDASTNINMIEKYTITMEDEARRRHKMTINIPKFIDNRFLYLNGSKKSIQKQFMGLPIIKTDMDTVQICTNYNKIFIRRVGTKFNPNMEKLRKYIESPANGVKVVRGRNLDTNKQYLTCLEYDQLSDTYNSIEIGHCKFIFNAKELSDVFGGKYSSSKTKTLIGVKTVGNKKEPIFYDTENPNHDDMVATMIQVASPEKYGDFKKLTFGKKYMYTQATILRKKIPVILVILFFEGMTTVLKKFNDSNITFTDKKSNQDNNMYIPFSDGYLTYPMNDMEASLMFNGLTELPTALYSIADMDDRDTYISFFEHLFGSGYIAGGLMNYYDFMIDPITLKIIRMLNYPEDIVSLIIYANNLLADNDFIFDMNLSLYRLRDNEIIPAVVYKEMTVAYSKYRKTYQNNNPVKMSVDPDCVIKALNKLTTVESYSKLSPATELKSNYTVSMKGFVGVNNDEVYNQARRVFDDSMIGIIGVSTDIAANCGKEKHLVLEPNVTNAYGMLKLAGREHLNELKDVNLQTSLEMMCPGGLLHDDPVRTAMASKQSGHAIPVKDQSPLLVSNGSDATIHYRTCDDFSVVAEEDGEVIDFDPKVEIMVVQYKSGKKKAIDLATSIAKNGGGGMYLENKLSTSFKKGDKFKKDAILAYDSSFYKELGVFGNKLSFGTLVKSTIISSPSTYEDSSWCTKRMSERMASDITMRKLVVIKKNSNVDFIVKKGDSIRIGDDLIRFDTSYEEDDLNNLLSNVRDDMKEEIINLGKSKVSSKYTGVIRDVVVYPTIPLEEMTPSLRKSVKNIQDELKRRKKFLDKYEPESHNAVYRMGVLIDKPDDIVQPDQYGKILGKDVEDGVLFAFYITYHDELSDGDKLAHMTANKATIGYMIPEGMEPYTAFRPYEEISVPIAPSAVLQRGTPSIKITMVYYKVLIELKRALYELFTGESWNDKQKRENTYMLKPESIRESSVAEPNELSPIMEVTFGLAKSPRGEYFSLTYHDAGDVILPMDHTKNPNVAKKWFLMKEETDLQPNIRYNEELNVIEATSPIYEGEMLIME